MARAAQFNDEYKRLPVQFPLDVWAAVEHRQHESGQSSSSAAVSLIRDAMAIHALGVSTESLLRDLAVGEDARRALVELHRDALAVLNAQDANACAELGRKLALGLAASAMNVLSRAAPSSAPPSIPAGKISLSRPTEETLPRSKTAPDSEPSAGRRETRTPASDRRAPAKP